MLDRIPKSKQIELNEIYGVEAAESLVTDIQERAEWLAELSTQRLDDGYAVFEDEMFWQEDPRLVREIDEELADAVNRRVVQLARRDGLLPNPWLGAELA